MFWHEEAAKHALDALGFKATAALSENAEAKRNASVCMIISIARAEEASKWAAQEERRHGSMFPGVSP